MNIDNQTRFPVFVSPNYGPGDHDVLTIVLKGTFDLVPGSPAKPAEEPEPIAFADQLAESPRGAVPLFDSDLAPFKPGADLLLVAKAHAPRGRPIDELDVSLKLGRIDKTVRVLGERRWGGGGLGRDPKPSDPKPFTECDLTYAEAFGGVDGKSGGASDLNPIGLGFITEKAKKSTVEGVPLPRLENPRELIESWKDRPPPAAFSAVGRGWSERARHLGTYDDRWKKERSPRPPRDFSFAFYNAAPPDQQAQGFFTGREPFELVNVSEKGTLAGELPGVQPRVSVRREGKTAPEEIAMNLDTVVLNPERMRLLLTWRGTAPIAAPANHDVREVEFAMKPR